MNQHDWKLLVFGVIMGFFTGLGFTLMTFVYLIL